MEYHLVIEQNEILPLAITQMDLEGIMLNEVNQTEKDKYGMISFTWRIWKIQKSKNQAYG